MAHHASAKKRIRQTAKRTLRNKHIRSTMRTYIKHVRGAIEDGDAQGAQAALREAIRHIDMAVSKGVLKRETGSRYVSRLSRQVTAL